MTQPHSNQSVVEQILVRSREPLPFEVKHEAGEEFIEGRYNLSQDVKQGGTMGQAEGGRRMLIRIADEIQLQGNLPTGHLGVLSRVDRYTLDELHYRYEQLFPEGNRPLTTIVTEEVVRDFLSRETDLISLAAGVARAFKTAYVAEILGIKELKSDSEIYRKGRRLMDEPILGDDFWRPYQTGIRAGLKLAKSAFDNRPTVWVPTRRSHYSTTLGGLSVS